MAKRTRERPVAAKPCKLDCDAPSAPNSTICASHATHTHNGVLALGTFARDSYEYELAGALATNTAPRLSGSKSPPMVVDERIADHRRNVRHLLASWALNVADERQVGIANVVTGIKTFAGPLCVMAGSRYCKHDSCRRLIASRRPQPDGAYGVLAGFLRRHHDWIMCQYFAADYAREILNAAHTAHGLLNPSGVRVQRDIAPCERPECRGSLYAIRRDTEDLLPSAIKCNVCGAEIPSTQWLKFGARVLERREREAVA